MVTIILLVLLAVTTVACGAGYWTDAGYISYDSYAYSNCPRHDTNRYLNCTYCHWQ